MICGSSDYGISPHWRDVRSDTRYIKEGASGSPPDIFKPTEIFAIGNAHAKIRNDSSRDMISAPLEHHAACSSNIVGLKKFMDTLEVLHTFKSHLICRLRMKGNGYSSTNIPLDFRPWDMIKLSQKWPVTDSSRDQDMSKARRVMHLHDRSRPTVQYNITGKATRARHPPTERMVKI